MKTIIIAEAGVNHNGDLKKALKMVNIAARANADFIKFQTFIPENLAQSKLGLAKYQKKQVEAKKESVQKYLSTNARKLFYSANDGVVGNPQGKTSLLILSDYRCGYCSKARAILDEVIKENDDLRVVVKQLPILGPESKYAAKAATLAQQKNLFTTFDSKLSALEKPITVEKVNTAMRQSGLKEKDITAQKDNLDAVIRETYVHAQNLAVQGAPVLIVANSNLTKVEFIENTMDKKAIQAKLKEIS